MQSDGTKEKEKRIQYGTLIVVSFLQYRVEYPMMCIVYF